MPKFTKSDLGMAAGALVGIVLYKRYVRPVVQGVS